MTDPRPWREDSDGLILHVRATPRSRQSLVGGVAELGDGKLALAVKLRSPPADGAANDELIAVLSKALVVPRSAIVLLSGTTARTKQIRIRRSAAQIGPRLEALLGSH